MPSPTEKTSTDTLTNLKDGMEPSQEISRVNLDNDEVINQENQVQQQQQQQQPQQPQQQEPQSQPQHNQTTSTTSVATLESSSSPSQMIDATIVNDVVNATASASVTPPNDANPTTTTTTSTPINNTQNISQDTSNPSAIKRKSRITVDRPRRKTRNTTKASMTSQGEQSTTPKKILSAAPSQTTRRGTNEIDINGPLDFNSSNGRQLPSKDGISQSNIADRFVDFIMYCNPSAPESLDKAALIRYFNAVPKSDGKVFQTWSLYQLVGKHYAGEIRTWTKLAQKLGVVRTPEASPQKIQQYAVRLKKWMASVHVDAYFNYLLSRPNDYYQFPQKNTTEVDDESDVVLKLIKRAGSKRQKRKYTRKNTNSSAMSNDEGTTNPEGTSATEFDDDHFESEDVDDGNDKHRDKRARASYSDENEGSEEDDRDPWVMDIEEEEEEEGEDTERPTESTGTNQRRKSVQVGLDPCWVKDNVMEEENENIVGGRLGVRKEANPENDSSRYYRQYPSQFAGLPHLIEPKNGSDIPTPNPSPTTLPVMNLSSGNNTGNKRVLSHSGATGGAGTQKYRWRMISMGPTYAVKTSADESYLTTSPSSSQKEPKKKQDAGQGRETKQPSMVRQRNPATVPSDQQISDERNFAELFLPSTLPNNDKDAITLLQKNLVSAVGLLEDSQRRINLLNTLVHQRDEDVRQRVVRAIKSKVDGVFEKFQ